VANRLKGVGDEALKKADDDKAAADKAAAEAKAAQAKADAAKVAAEYIKRTGGKKGLEFANQQEANRAITQAIGGSKLNLDKGYGAELLNKVEKNSKNYSDVGTGSQIDQASKDNKDMKSQEKSSSPPIQQNTTNVNNTTESSSAPAVNDRPKHDRK